jgi:hypothetical protein
MNDQQSQRHVNEVLLRYLSGEASENEALAAVSRVAGGPVSRAQFRAIVQQAEQAEMPSSNVWPTMYIDEEVHRGPLRGEHGGAAGTDTYVEDSSTEVMICEVCENRLNRFTMPDGGETWVHARAFGNYDHEPVPKAVPRDSLTDTTCDFCADKVPGYMAYVGQRMRTATQGMLNDFGTTWTACEPCAHLIDDGDLEGLVNRVQRRSPELARAVGSMGLADWRGQMVKMWTTFLRTVHEKIYLGPKREPARLNPRLMPKIQLGLIKFWADPGIQELYYQRRAENGQTHSLPGVHIGREDYFMVQIPPGERVPDEAWTNHVQHLTAGLYGSDLYWIAENFTQLAIMAGKDLTSLNLTRESLPSKFGLMVYDRPIGEINRKFAPAGIRAVSWTLIPDGIWLNLYVQLEDGESPDMDVESLRAKWGYLMSLNSGSGLPFDTGGPPIEDVDDEQFGWIKTIFATWFLIGQPGVAESRPAPVDKKLARSYQRAHGRKLPDVQLIDLRRQPKRSTAPDAESSTGRKLTVRVFRSGHWKQQAYGPKRGLRRPIYVSEYIAGPDGAPLKPRSRSVKVLR